MKAENIILICGSPRSGSTLLYNSICSSGLFNPSLPENHLVPNLIKNLRRQINRNKKEMYMHFESDEVTIDFFKKIIEDYFDDIISKYKVKNLALKSLLFGSCIDILLKMFSFLNPIFIIRDPRDIISSLLEISKKQIESNIKPNYPNNISLLCNFINDHYKFLLDDGYKQITNKVEIIKYEDLVSNTNETLNNLIKRVKINYTYKKNHSFWDNANNINPNNNPYNSFLWNKKPSTERIGIYKKLLKESDVLEINLLCKDLLNKFNY